VFSEVHVLLSAPEWERTAHKFASIVGAEPNSQIANLVIVDPFYSRSWDFDLRSIKGVPVVSDIQLYLDLSTYPRRGAEQADRLRDRIVQSVDRR
jgi:hypothetical protein